MEALECGAAALSIVLAYFGRWVPLEELRGACGVSRNGSNAGNIVKAARNYGLEARGMRVDLEAIGQMPLPAIVFWNFNHFVVVEGLSPKGVFLNDPAMGPRKVSWEEFDAAFTGLSIAVSPSLAFERGGSPPSVVAGLSQRLRGGTSPLILCLLAGIGLLVPGLVVPASVRIFVNEYLGLANRSWLWPLVVGVGLAAAVQVALTWLQQITLLRLSTKLSISMSTRFFKHVLNLPLAFFAQRYGGNIATRVQVNDQIASLLSSQLSASALGLLTASLYLVLMAIYDWQLTIVSVVFATGNLLALAAMIRRQKDASRRLVQDSGKLTATAVSGLQSIETIRSTSEDSSFFSRWSGQQAKVLEATQSLGALSSILGTLPTLLSSLNMAVVIGFGGFQVMAGTLSIGTLAAFQILVGGFTGPLAQLVGFGAVLQQTAGSLASVDDVLDYPPDPLVASESEDPAAEGAERVPASPRRHLPEADANAPLPSRLAGRLDLVDITFGYSPLAPPLIENFSLTVLPGQRVALVGPTGSGKSTLAGLVVGLNRPWSGKVLLDGFERDEIPRPLLASSLSLVDQDIRLFSGTVRDNLTLWDPTIEERAVVRAARDACIHDDVLRRVGGYDGLVQEDGRDFSGGQRQRIELARGLVKDPSFLVLDEATSALDPLVELQVDRHIRERGCSCLIVAHRLSTIRDANEIIVLDKGQVVERGTHDDLVEHDGLYKVLVSA
jgi:NHLM bacteriocin system ABC transporter peptidase/ATP-binding protein